MIVYSCHSEFMPLHQIRRLIDQEITKYSYEHLIIYIDSAQKEQVWQWIRKEKNQPLAKKN